MIVLLSKDGAPVTDFGTNGNLISDLGGPADAWYGVALSSDKKSVIVAGYKGTDATSGGNDDAVVASGEDRRLTYTRPFDGRSESG